MASAPPPALSAGFLVRSDAETSVLSVDLHRFTYSQEYHACVCAISSLADCNDLNKVSVVMKKTMKIKIFFKVKVRFEFCRFCFYWTFCLDLLGPSCLPWSEPNIM